MEPLHAFPEMIFPALWTQIPRRWIMGKPLSAAPGDSSGIKEFSFQGGRMGHGAAFAVVWGEMSCQGSKSYFPLIFLPEFFQKPLPPHSCRTETPLLFLNNRLKQTLTPSSLPLISTRRLKLNAPKNAGVRNKTSHSARKGYKNPPTGIKREKSLVFFILTSPDTEQNPAPLGSGR